MAKRKFHPEALRQFAREFLGKVAEEEAAPDVEREDYVTSLVRQWQSYEGNASFFVGDKLIHVTVANAGPGKFRIALNTAPADLMTSFQTQWQLSAAELPGILESLNLRQTAETINTAGTPLCISVIPDKGKLEVVHPPKTQPKVPVNETVNRKTADKRLMPPLPTQP